MKNLQTIEQCCSPLLEAPLGGDDARQLAMGFKVLGDPARLRILSLVAAAPSGEMCVCEMIGPLELAQPTVSHHLKVLNAAGLLQREKRGTWAYYRVVPERLEALRSAMSTPVAAGLSPASSS